MSKMPRIPAEIRFATAEDAAAIAKVHVASWKSTYPGIVPQSYLDSLNVEEFTERWQSRLDIPSEAVTYVAVSEGTVCGFASAGPARAEKPGFSGELYALYLAQEAQSKRIGSRLFWTLAKHLERAGHGGMYVWVLEENPAHGFYERMGGSLHSTTEIDIGGKLLREVCYGWDELAAAIAQVPASSRDSA